MTKSAVPDLYATPLPRPPSWLGRFFFAAPARIVIGSLALALTAGLTYALVKAVVPLAADRFVWPHLLACALVMLVYWLFVKAMEGRRALVELAPAGAGRELGTGLAIGALAVAISVGLLALSGNYRLTGANPWSAQIAGPLAEMLFVGAFEELLFRAVIFRISERALGSWPALIVSGILFALAHLGEGISAMGLANTFMAGMMFSAAWMVTRRLWLCMAIHAGWNYVLGSIFSIAVSGHPARGLLDGALDGPDWVTGGIYGLEGSVATFVVIGALFVILLRWAGVKGHVLPVSWGKAARAGMSIPTPN